MTQQNVVLTQARYAFIDGIRAIAALYVILSHAFLEQSNGHFHTYILALFPAWSAHFAVDIFINSVCLLSLYGI